MVILSSLFLTLSFFANAQAQGANSTPATGVSQPAAVSTPAPVQTPDPAPVTPAITAPVAVQAPRVDQKPQSLDGAAATPVPAVDPIKIPSIVLTPPAPHDLSPMGMFWAADPIVKGVMILLAAASVLTWTVFFIKIFSLAIAKHRMRKAIKSLRIAGDITQASATIGKGVGARLMSEALVETELSQGLANEGIKERVHIALSRVETTISRHMAIGMGLLATVGSVGPFVGLFGTVWGIMRSFIGIATSNTTNLAVVAPGIAEALLATGIGLVAAIPAVIIYNALTRSISSYRAMTADATALIMRHISRDLDRIEHTMFSQNRASMRPAAE